MAKWAGTIAFAIEVEQEPGIWVTQIKEKKYTGDLIKKRIMFQDISAISDRPNVSNQISFIADPFALSNFNTIQYVTFMGFKWKVKDFEFELPRVNLTMGDLYNEN